MKKIHTLAGLLILTVILAGCSKQAPAQEAGGSGGDHAAATGDAAGDAESSGLLAFAPQSVPSSLMSSESPQSGGLEGQITEQSFDVNLNGWEHVTFASFQPEQNEQGDGDVRFMLLKDGKDIYDFPGVTKDNRCPGEKFDQVSAAAFKDYNEDGKTDIILILQYSPQDHPDKPVQKVRLYTQTGNSKEFTYDQYLAEHLTGEGCSTIADVMDGIAESRNFQEALNEPKNGSIENQLKLIADNRSLWALTPDGSFSAYSYAVTDLDQNGRLEVIVSNTQGSGHFTDSLYYEVNAAFDGLNDCNQNKKEGDPQGKLGSSVPVYCDSKTNACYYIETNSVNAGSSVTEVKSSLSLINGMTELKPLASHTVEKNGTEIFQDADNKTISQDAYNAIADSVYSGLTKKQASITWISALGTDGADPMTAGSQQLIDKLSQSYSGFSIR